MDKATADSLSVQSFAISKNSEHRNFVIGRFQTRARNGLSVWDWPVHSRTRPTDTPSPIFSEGRGAAVHRLSETDNPSSNCPSKLTDKVRRIVHSKLKPFPFQFKTFYLLPRIIKPITNLTWIIRLYCENGYFCYKWMSPPHSLNHGASACLLFLFHKDYF